MKVEGKQFEYLKTFLLLAVIFVILVLLKKFGLLKFGDSKEEKDVKALNEIKNFQPEYERVLYEAMKKKLGVSKPTTAQIQQFIPTTNQLKTWTNNLWDAKQFFNDDESKSYGVFRSMDSQLDVWGFAKFFQSIKNKDLFGYLESYLDAEEISMIYNIIKQKTLI
jgi:hypothetical protein